MFGGAGTAKGACGGVGATPRPFAGSEVGLLFRYGRVWLRFAEMLSKIRQEFRRAVTRAELKEGVLSKSNMYS